MDTVTVFLNHAASCRTMAKVSDDPQNRVVWERMAERWLVCAKLAQERMSAARAQAENQRRHRGRVHGWAH
jgi:hypothetical protein